MEKKANDVLFYQGDIGLRYFIIIDGLIDILADSRKNCQLSEELATHTAKKLRHPDFNVFRYSKKIVSLGVGASFGEIALRN